MFDSVWIIECVNEREVLVASSREIAYRLAREYVDNVVLQPDVRSSYIEELDNDYNSQDGDFGIVGYINVMNLPIYDRI